MKWLWFSGLMLWLFFVGVVLLALFAFLWITMP